MSTWFLHVVAVSRYIVTHRSDACGTPSGWTSQRLSTRAGSRGAARCCGSAALRQAFSAPPAGHERARRRRAAPAPAPPRSQPGSSRASSPPSRPRGRSSRRTTGSGATCATADPGVPLVAARRRARRLHVQADPRRAGGHLALRRRGHVLRVRAGGDSGRRGSCGASSARTATALAIFRTIYPGWYPGRTVHIHVRVYVGGDVVHTGQLYFPDALTDAVFRRVPYSRRPARTTRNPSDALYRNGGSRSMLKLTRSGTGYVARITMGVQLR